MKLDIDPDIHRAHLPPPALYRDEAWQRALAERVLARTWHVAASRRLAPGHVRATTLLPTVLDEPVLFTRDAEGTHRALSNACSHRGHLLVDPDQPARPLARLRCGYHGRRFDLSGRAQASPGFPVLEGCDQPPVASETRGPLTFAAIDPLVSLEDWLAPARDLLDLEALGPRAHAEDRSFDIAAHWALYVDNYLEGLHIPFVHPALARAVDLERYEVHRLPQGVLQLGLPPGGREGALTLANGRRVEAAWLWLFPTTMINVYPWGVSLNIVQPRAGGTCRVLYRSFVSDPSRRDQGAGADLHKVEAEDQAAVTRVQRGLAARSWRPGRYAPEHERGTHHFHRLLAEALDRSAP